MTPKEEKASLIINKAHSFLTASENTGQKRQCEGEEEAEFKDKCNKSILPHLQMTQVMGFS